MRALRLGPTHQPAEVPPHAVRLFGIKLRHGVGIREDPPRLFPALTDLLLLFGGEVRNVFGFPVFVSVHTGQDTEGRGFVGSEMGPLDGIEPPRARLQGECPPLGVSGERPKRPASSALAVRISDVPPSHPPSACDDVPDPPAPASTSTKLPLLAVSPAPCCGRLRQVKERQGPIAVPDESIPKKLPGAPPKRRTGEGVLWVRERPGLKGKDNRNVERTRRGRL